MKLLRHSPSVERLNSCFFSRTEKLLGPLDKRIECFHNQIKGGGKGVVAANVIYPEINELRQTFLNEMGAVVKPVQSSIHIAEKSEKPVVLVGVKEHDSTFSLNISTVSRKVSKFVNPSIKQLIIFSLVLCDIAIYLAPLLPINLFNLKKYTDPLSDFHMIIAFFWAFVAFKLTRVLHSKIGRIPALLLTDEKTSAKKFLQDLQKNGRDFVAQVNAVEKDVRETVDKAGHCE